MILSIQALNFLKGQKIKRKDRIIELRFQITLSCGCPTCAGGRFDASRFDVDVKIISDDGKIYKGKGIFTGNVSEFLAHVPVEFSGDANLEIYAVDKETGAAGRLFMPIKIE